MTLLTNMRLIALACLCMVAVGCTDEVPEVSESCEERDVAGETYCVYSQPITETGYTCPSSFPNAHQFESGTVCSEGEEIPEEAIDEFIEEFGSRLDPPLGGARLGEICGTDAGITCIDSLFCDYSGNNECLVDAGGVCAQADASAVPVRPDDEPVCGCDGVEYGSDSERRSAGVALDPEEGCFETNCLAMPVCEELEDEFTSQSDCEENHADCHEVAMCGSAIWCGSPQEVCRAIPTCDDGDEEVASESDCLQDDAVCYEATMCGSTIWCTGPDATEVTLISGGYSFGECIGACRWELTLEGDDATLTVSDWGDEPALHTADGTFTTAGMEELALILGDLQGVELQETYGCPDCDDGGEAHAMLDRGLVEPLHSWPMGEPPTVLEDLDDFILGTIDDLSDCKETDELAPSEDCVEWTE